MRRNDSTGELAYYRCYHPHPVPLGELVRVAGQRWTIEESFQSAKGQAGLDEHQVRTWTSWHRWTVLCMLAMAFLAVVTAAERDRTPTPTGMIPIHPQRDPPAVRRTHHRPSQQNPRPHPALVQLAPTTPSNRPRMPLSPQVTAPLNPIYPCRTSPIRHAHRLPSGNSAQSHPHKITDYILTRSRTTSSQDQGLS